MKNEVKITRRTFIILNLKILLFLLLTAKIFLLQIFSKKKYVELDEKNRVKIKHLLPKRGYITTHNCHALATEKKYFSLAIQKKTTSNSDIKIISEKISNLLKKPNLSIYIQKNFSFSINEETKEVILLEDLNDKDVLIMEENLFNLEGVYIKSTHTRFYPMNKTLCHVIGYVGLINKNEKKSYTDLNQIDDILIGKNGLESYYNDILIGKCGKKIIEFDAKNKPIKTLKTIFSKNGDELKISIDLDLQKIIETQLHNQKGAIVVSNLKTHKIESLISTPEFNLNSMVINTIKKNSQCWQNIFHHPQTPLINRAIQSVYPPGSIFKIVTFLSALQKNISPNTVIECKGKITMADKIFNCNNKQGHGRINMASAFEKSCNCYTYYLATEVGADKIMQTCNLLGLFHKSDIDLPYETNNKMHLIEKKISTKKWKIGDTINLSIGQGFAGLTIMQMLNLITTIATGNKISPKININSQSSITPCNIDKEHLHFLRQCMFNTVNSPSGTAYSGKININGMQFAGKTGTAQVTKISQSNHQKKKELDDHSIFIGYGPFNDPSYSLAILVENAGLGSKKAVPIAQCIFSYLFNKI